MSEGAVPTCFKSALVTPLLKKEGLDVTEYKNYRPVSNLPFASKLLERVVAKQLTEHMTQHKLHDPLQSAYRPKHSTETALLKIKCDTDQALDRGEGTIILLLDLSAAFDTLDHNVIIERLSHCVGISGQASKWFRSYLSERYQSVYINGTQSHPVRLSLGVPQGSVLGPLLFMIYMLPLKDVIDQHSVMRHGYADDGQTYEHFNLRDTNSLKDAILTLEHCASDIREWMVCNKLKLNDAKSELLIIAPKQYHSKLFTGRSAPVLRIGDATITPSAVVRNLGANLDSSIDMSKQCSAVTRSMYFHLRRIAKIRCHLDQQAAARAVQATVISRLDYCNIAMLQRAQNSAAHVVTKSSKRSHITPILRGLHWLPVHERVIFKTLVHVYTILHDPNAPQYLSAFLVPHAPKRTLRSGSLYKPLRIPRTSSQAGDRAFCKFIMS